MNVMSQKLLVASVLLVELALVVSGCARPRPDLAPEARVAYLADRAVVALGTLQHVAIEFNRIQVCEPEPCRPLLSDANTRAVVDGVADALQVLRVAPGGWKVTVTTALDRIARRLDATGRRQLAAYIEAARIVIDEVARAGEARYDVAA